MAEREKAKTPRSFYVSEADRQAIRDLIAANRNGGATEAENMAGEAGDVVLVYMDPPGICTEYIANHSA